MKEMKIHPWRHWEWLVLLGLVMFFGGYSPNPVLATVSDFFYHFDSFFMAPGWAAISGLRLNVDVNSEYSVLIPTLTAKLLDRIGHFDYPSVLRTLIMAAMIYFIMFYLFLRSLTRNTAAAGAGLLAAIGFQMFHSGVYPVLWQFPSATAIRFFWDIPVLALLLAHARQGQTVYVLAGSCVTGIALMWMMDTGVYLYLAFSAYVVWTNVYHKKFFEGLWCLLIPWAMAFAIGWAIGRKDIFTPLYWHNTFEFAGLFLQGWGALPVTTSLEQHRYVAFGMGLLIPVFYVWTMLCVGTLCFLRRLAWENILACVLCVYGLGLYHYYVVRSAPTSYAVVCLPAVALVFWILGRLNPRKLMWLPIYGGLGLFFWANPLVRTYPQLWSSGMTWAGEFSTDLELSQDAALIQDLTDPSQRVPLLSSFEVKILMQAKRKPYFYYFPIFQSDAMRMLQFRGTYIHTHSRMKKIVQALETDRPPLIFVEKKFFNGSIPAVYYRRFQTLMMLMSYCHQKYEPYKEGKYLMALKRKI